MDLRQLRYFTAIVEEGTISAAARKLNISQPPLSLQIRMLEDEYGTKLFERGARQITLTDAGRMLYRYAAGILELEAAADKDLRSLSAGRSGVIRIGLVSSFYSGSMFAALKSFHRKYPLVQFQISEGNTYQLIEHLHKGRIELAVIRTPYQDRTLESLVLEQDRIVAAWRPEEADRLPAARARSAAEGGTGCIRIRDLRDTPLILYRRWEKIIRAGFEQSGTRPDILCVADDARTALQWADEGLGMALVPRSAMHGSPQLSFLPVDGDSMQTSLCLVRMQMADLSRSAGLFVSELTGSARLS